jgi:rhamnogalacturonyl hydrolase YesR
MRSRLRRTPLEVATQLAAVYGHELQSAVYIPAVAVIGRLRLGELTGDPKIREDVERIVRPYLEGKPTLGDRPTGSHLPGHLIFGELARTGDDAYARLALKAADLGFDANGQPLESMPLHNEMSDSVFMGCAILAQAGRLTGDERYYRMALRHLRFMEALDLRPDGLYRHSPLDEAAWGRGNGFPALGLTWSLSEMPGNSPGRSEFLTAYRELVGALLQHQDATGMWRQVIDREQSYRELTATSMIGYALSVGLSRKWIAGEGYERALARAWYGVRTRIASDGSLVDVCTGTGKQASLRAYYDRPAILGRDDRGGAMALLFAVEMARRNASN